MSIAAGKYRIPFRTPKSSSPAAMVLHLKVWKSSTAQPSIFKSSSEGNSLEELFSSGAALEGVLSVIRMAALFGDGLICCS